MVQPDRDTRRVSCRVLMEHHANVRANILKAQEKDLLLQPHSPLSASMRSQSTSVPLITAEQFRDKRMIRQFLGHVAIQPRAAITSTSKLRALVLPSRRLINVRQRHCDEMRS